MIKDSFGVRKRDLTIYRENELFAVLLKVRRFAPRFSTPLRHLFIFSASVFFGSLPIGLAGLQYD